MMRWLVLILSVFATPLVAQPAPSATIAASRQALGLQLAEITNSEALSRVQLDKMLRETFPKQMAANPDFVELESMFPGVSAKVVDALAPIVMTGVLERLPTLWERIGVIYASEFSERELRQLIGFYSSPVGVRLIDIMGRRSDFSKAIDTVLRDPDAKLSPDDMKSGLQIGIRGVVQELTPAETAEIRRFFESSPVGAKMVAVTPRVQSTAADWGNEPSPELDAQVEAAVQAVLKPYIDGKVAP